MGGREAEIRWYRPGDEHQIVPLFEQVFGRARTMDEWRWRYMGSPAGEAAILVAVDGDRVVGGTAAIRHRGYIDGELSMLAVGVDAMLLPEYRGRATLMKMRHFTRDLPYDARVDFPADHVVAQGRGESRSRRNLGKLPQWIRWLTPAGVAASRTTGRLSVPTAITGPALAARVGSAVGAWGWSVEPLELGADVDALVARSASFARCIGRRDSEHLRWRWVESRATRYTLVGALDRRHQLGGLAVFGVPGRTRGLARVGRITDLLADSAGAQVALLDHAIAALRRDSCDMVTLDFLDPRRWSGPACLAAGFVRRGTGINLDATMITERGAPALERSSWYLTRGDSDLG